MSGVKAPVGRPTIATQMAAVPIRNERLRVLEDATGVSLTRDVVYKAWMKPFVRFLRMPPSRTLRLEGIGWEVWKRLDGKTSIGDIVSTFAQERKLSYHESRALLMNYFRSLVERGVIVIVGIEKAVEESGLAV
jgi:hypothetical protein